MSIDNVKAVISLINHWINNKDIVEVKIGDRTDILRINRISDFMVDMNNPDLCSIQMNVSLVSITSRSIHFEHDYAYQSKFEHMEKAWPISDQEYNNKVNDELNSFKIKA